MPRGVIGNTRDFGSFILGSSPSGVVIAHGSPVSAGLFFCPNRLQPFETMPEIQAFRGLRYNLARVGSISDCVAPPYDVIDSGLQDQLYNRSPFNFVQLELNRPESTDQDADSPYQRAGLLYRKWKTEGILQWENDPALYVYHQEFEVEGVPVTRRGFVANVKLERFGEGRVFPHEETLASAKEDRLKLLRATEANLSPIFGLYSDPENEIQSILEQKIIGVQGLVAVDHLGVVHKLWPVSDVNTIQQITALVCEKELFVADGHHRYETACNYRDELAAEGVLHDAHPAHFVMTTLVSMDDPGMIVLPTHRLFEGVPEFSTEELQAKLSPYFDCEVVGEGPEAAGAVWAEIDRLDEQWILALYATKSQQWIRISARQEGADRMAALSADRSSEWQSLGVSILHRLIIPDLLGITDLPKPTYVHTVHEVIDGLSGKLAEKRTYPLAALLMPASLEHVQEISIQQERMPAKSTYFYPKLLSGLVINPLS